MIEEIIDLKEIGVTLVTGEPVDEQFYEKELDYIRRHDSIMYVTYEVNVPNGVWGVKQMNLAIRKDGAVFCGDMETIHLLAGG